MFGAPVPHPRQSTGLGDVPPGAKVLWVTSNGGHLSELSTIDSYLEASSESLWITFDSPQTAAFLRDRRHHFVDYVAPRDFGAAVRAAKCVAPLLRREHFDACISTGAAVAATILPLAARAGIPTYYVESLARPTGPSLTGKLLARAPGVNTCSQYSEWSSRKWPCTRSALEGWRAVESPRTPGPLNILVTLGTQHGYRFDRAVDAVRQLLRPADQVVWQLGATTRNDLPGRVLDEVSQDELNRLALAADVVVAHSGVGSILAQFELGKSPVLAVRSGTLNEHVDNHQQGFADTTAGRGLTSILDLSAPRREVLERAAGRMVLAVGQSASLSVAA